MRRANPLLTPYEHSVYEQMRLRALGELRLIEFDLIANHDVTLFPHTAPFDDMQRMDALETLATELDDLERAYRRARRIQTVLDVPLFVIWWPLRWWFRPPPYGRALSGKKAADALKYVESQVAAVASGYKSYRDMLEDLPRQAEYAEYIVFEREMHNSIFRPHERLLDYLIWLEALLDYKLLELAVVGPCAPDAFRSTKGPEDAILSGLDLDVHDIMVRIEHIKVFRFVINAVLFAPWWIVRAITWPLSKFRRGAARAS